MKQHPPGPPQGGMKRDEATPPRPPSRGDEEGELPQGEDEEKQLCQ
jgi:hypothetical protein